MTYIFVDKPPNHDEHGFTMMEIVMVLILLGVLSAVVLSRYSANDTYKAAAEEDVVKNHLRYAQARAMNSNAEWRIVFAAKSYQLFKIEGGVAVVKRLPGETSDTINLSDLEIQAPLPTVTFNGSGSPVDTAGVLLAADLTIDTNAQDIIIRKNTGFIP